MMNYICSVSPF